MTTETTENTGIALKDDGLDHTLHLSSFCALCREKTSVTSVFSVFSVVKPARFRSNIK